MTKLINVVHSLNEQKKAIKEMFDLFPSATFESCCNSFNSRSYSSFEVNVPFEKFIPVAKKYIVTKRGELFDWGTPKVIKSNYSIWEDFLSIRLFWYGNYNYYYSDSWHLHKRRPIGTSISLRSCEYRQGLNHWKTKYRTLKNLLNKNPNKELIKAYKSEIEKINKELMEWEEAIKKAGDIDLNGQIKS